jgi:hypothetical protein
MTGVNPPLLHGSKDSDSAKVSILVPASDLEVAANMAEYIRSAREDLVPLGVDWSSWRWRPFGTFVKLHAARQGKTCSEIPPEQWLDPAFIEFARAFIREQQSRNPRESAGLSRQRFMGLRLVEAALLEIHGVADPCQVTAEVLNRAVDFARARYSQQTAYATAQNVQYVADLLSRRRMTVGSIAHWKSSIRKGRSAGSTVGSAGEKARQAKLPAPDAIKALAEIFCRDLDPSDPRCQRDIYVTGVTAILLGAPSRGGNEVHHLPRQLSVRATDKFGKKQTGLRWEAAKGFGSYVKWIWSGMVPAVEIAIERLDRITEEARTVARWLEDPATRNRFYRHPDCPKVGDDEPLSCKQACEALGMSTSRTAQTLRQRGLSQAEGALTLDFLWNKHVLPRHHKAHPHFPYVDKTEAAKGKKGGLKFSESLFCMLRYQLSERVNTNPFELWMPSLSSYSQHVSFEEDRTNPTIFERYGYAGSDGQPLTLKSHAIRHLLNTEAQRSGMTDDEIAWWSGRKNVHQNQVYNHVTEQERVDRARKYTNDSTALATTPVEPDQGRSVITHGHWKIDVGHRPVFWANHEIQPRVAGLQTLYGRCDHDWALAPCEGFVTCLNCSDHSCVKGQGSDEQMKLQRVKDLIKKVSADVAQARGAVRDGDWGAADWLEVQTKWLAKITELANILESAEVPEGSIIKLAGADHQTHLHRVLRNVAMQALEDNSAPEHVIRTMLEAIAPQADNSGAVTTRRSDSSERGAHGT